MELTESERVVLAKARRTETPLSQRIVRVLRWSLPLFMFGMAAAVALFSYRVYIQGLAEADFLAKTSPTPTGKAFLMGYQTAGAQALVLGTYGSFGLLFLFMGIYFLPALAPVPFLEARTRLLVRLADRLKELGDLEEAAKPADSPEGPKAPASG